MNRKDFIQYLNKYGKKEHVIENLISHVSAFEVFLESKYGKKLKQAEANDLRLFLEVVESEKLGTAKKYCRGIQLYYKMTNNNLYHIASNYRKSAIKKTRVEFPLRRFEDIDLDCVGKLESAGVKTAPQLLKVCKTENDRRKLAKLCGVSQKAILKLTKLSDLSRITGVKAIRARLYYDSGIDTVEKLAKWNFEELLVYLKSYIESSKFTGIAPLPKELRNTIAEAKRLKPVIRY